MEFDYYSETKENNKKLPYKKLSIVSLTIAILLCTVLIATYIHRKNDLERAKELQTLYYSNTSVEDFYKKSEAQSLEPHKVQERFKPLLEINSDTVAWIKAGELADEPVVYKDNDYYLKHDFTKQKNSSGAVFIDIENSNFQQDKYLILYGHYMKNGGKFGNLEKYRNIQDLKENLIIQWNTIYSNEPETYLVFSVFDASMAEDDNNYFYLRRFEELKTGDVERQKLIDELESRSIFNIPVKVNTNDKILALVTCSYGNKDGRLLVFSRKILANENIDSLKNTVSLKITKNSK